MRILHVITYSCMMLILPNTLCPPRAMRAALAAEDYSLIPQENHATSTLFDQNLRLCRMHAEQPWALGILRVASQIYLTYLIKAGVIVRDAYINDKDEIDDELVNKYGVVMIDTAGVMWKDEKLKILHPLIRTATNRACSIFDPSTSEPPSERLEKILSCILEYEGETLSLRKLLYRGVLEFFPLPKSLKTQYEIRLEVYEAFLLFYIDQFHRISARQQAIKRRTT